MSEGSDDMNAPVSFELSRVYATPGALRASEEAGQSPGEFLRRHLSGDWGEMDAHDSRLNNRAVRSGEDRIFSAYGTSAGEKLWVIITWNTKDGILSASSNL